MSTKTALLTAGLTALGWLWSATPSVVGQETAAQPGSPTSPAPSLTVLSLSDGRILRGPIRKEGPDYLLTMNGGEVRIPRKMVEGAFHSIDEVYRFKLERLAERDPDERLKLARWCLSQDKPDEAKTQLEAVMALVPNHVEARNMLFRLNATQELPGKRDEGLVQTSASLTEPTDPGRPGELSPDFFQPDDRAQPAVGLPIVLDLPPPLAVRRYQEFARFVHPELQRHCASCHDERSGRSFQLLRARTRRELMSDNLLLRTNLDATLRLINTEDPGKSELLIQSIMPHPPTRRPILSGPNDRAYQLFLTWINRLHESRPSGPEELSNTNQPALPMARTEGFASDRRPMTPPLTPIPDRSTSPGPTGPPDPTTPTASQPLPVNRMIPNSYPGSAPLPPPDEAFQTVSPLLGGPNAAPVPKVGGTPPTPATSANPPANPTPTPLYPPEFDHPEKSGQALKLDPALLEQVMTRSRQGTRR